MKTPVPRLLLILLVCSLGAAGHGQTRTELSLACDGADPDWSLTLHGAQAELNYGGASVLDIPQQSSAEGRDWPKVLTLVGQQDTAIVVLHPRRCDNALVTAYPIEATVLTQRGQSPVVLSGCCRYSD
ncbi:MAG: hypothetical protein JXR14_04185 [Paracoccaceae bacterium]